MPARNIARYPSVAAVAITTVAIVLLSTVACGIFSEEPIPAPTATPRSMAPAAIVPTQAPAAEAPGSVSMDSEFYRAVWTGDAGTVKSACGRWSGCQRN